MIQEKTMMKLAVSIVAVSSLLAGCVAYETPYRDSGPRYSQSDRDRDGIPNSRDRDRDGDGVPNSRDARPNNPNRY